LDVTNPLFGQLVTLLALAAALGMDAFSLGIGIGVKIQRKLQLLSISLLTGFFHMLFPLVGLIFGELIHHYVGSFALFCSGGLLLLLGYHMMFATRTENPDNHRTANVITTWGILAFAFSVSVDSLSIGVSMGIVGVDIWLTVSIFAIVAALLCALGLWLGKTMNRIIGQYGEWLGGLILMLIGAKFIYIGFM